MAYSIGFWDSLPCPIGDLPQAYNRAIVPPGTVWGPFHAEPEYAVHKRDIEAQRLAYENSSLDLFQALERHRKAEDAKQTLEDILSTAKVCLSENRSIDLGGSVKLIDLIVNTLDRSIRMFIEDPSGDVRFLKIPEEELKGCKDITEVVIKALSK